MSLGSKSLLLRSCVHNAWLGGQSCTLYWCTHIVFFSFLFYITYVRNVCTVIIGDVVYITCSSLLELFVWSLKLKLLIPLCCPIVIKGDVVHITYNSLLELFVWSLKLKLLIPLCCPFVIKGDVVQVNCSILNVQHCSQIAWWPVALSSA